MSALRPWAWGFDPAAGAIHFAAWRPHPTGLGMLRQSRHMGTIDGAERLALLRRQTVELVEGFLPTHPPVAVFVEQPVGRFPSPWLMAGWGVLMETLYTTLQDLREFPTMVEAYTPADWKKRAGLAGNADKDAIRARAVMLGALEGDWSEHQCDALIIAHMGWLELTKGKAV